MISLVIIMAAADLITKLRFANFFKKRKIQLLVKKKMKFMVK
ncbi:hypothetical protein [Pseudolactococcus paracarnosus]|nr:hypothetical protein [Lactococcus paracarnosus]SPC36697.1 hypothetical protein LPICM02_310008 [Lactococcus piscium]